MKDQTMQDVVLLGAGLTGLSAAYHLGADVPWALFERSSAAGGLAGTMEWGNGCRFDYTGHLLHVKDRRFDTLLNRLLPDLLLDHHRRTTVNSCGVRVPYPFQANTHGLPARVIKECLLGFVEARRNDFANQSSSDGKRTGSMAEWVRSTFGRGFERHFFRPFNEKLYRSTLEKLTADWTTWSIPVPSIEEVVGGALGLANPEYGYNAEFRYPREGGISVLPRALERDLVEPVHFGEEAVAVDIEKRVVRFRSGREVEFKVLITSLPLKNLLMMLEPGQQWAREAASGLRQVPVVDVNFAVGRQGVLDEHWIYFPEPDFSFYRVGSLTNFSRAVAPDGVSTLYAEVSVADDEIPDLDSIRDRVTADLVRCGVLRSESEVLRAEAVLLDPAYVIHDRFRLDNLDAILARLNDEGIISTGRYGRWHYGTMESAVLDGMDAAARARVRLEK